MWWSRRQLLAGLTLASAGCADFRPLHRPGVDHGINRSLASIDIPDARSRSMQTLRNALLDRLNPGSFVEPKRFKLDLQLKRRRRSLAVQLDDSVTRFDMVLTVTANLIELASGNTAYRTKITRRASFNVLREPFATLVAERDAERRATLEIANQIRAVLALYFEREARQPDILSGP